MEKVCCDCRSATSTLLQWHLAAAHMHSGSVPAVGNKVTNMMATALNTRSQLDTSTGYPTAACCSFHARVLQVTDLPESAAGRYQGRETGSHFVTGQWSRGKWLCTPSGGDGAPPMRAQTQSVHGAQSAAYQQALDQPGSMLLIDSNGLAWQPAVN